MSKYLIRLLPLMLSSAVGSLAEPIVTISVPQNWNLLPTESTKLCWIVVDPGAKLNLNCTLETTDKSLNSYLEDVEAYQSAPNYLGWRMISQITTKYGPFAVTTSQPAQHDDLRLLQVIGKVQDYAVVFSMGIGHDKLSEAVDLVLPLIKEMKFWDSEQALVDTALLDKWQQCSELTFEPLPDRLVGQIDLSEWMLAQFQIMRHIAEKRSNDFNQAEGSLAVQLPDEEAHFSDAICGDDL